MLSHENTFTLNKIIARIKLIEPLVFRLRQPLGSISYIEHESAGSAPLIHEPVDDSWQTLSPPCNWGGWNRNYTMRAAFTIPAEWDKSQLFALYFSLGSTDVWDFTHPENLLYIDGKEISAVDINHQTVYIPAEFCDGKEHQIAMHGYTGRWDIHDHDPGATMFMENNYLAQIDQPTRDLLALMRVASETAQRLDAKDFARIRILDALNSAQLKLHSSYSPCDAFYASVPAAMEVLQTELKKAGSAIDVELSAIGHSHIDVAWLWRLEQTKRKCGRSFNTVLALIKEHPEYIFTQSQPQLYEYVREEYPELFKGIQQAVKDGNWEIIGGMWVEADCNLTGSEALARQFLYGHRFFEKYFGKDTESPILWLPDVFGYSANLPQLIKQAGLDYFFTIKLSWSQFNRMPYDSFWWQGIDGTQILTHMGSTRTDMTARGVTYTGMATPEEVMNTWESCNQQEHHQNIMTCFGHGDGGGGPTREMLENIKIMNDFPGLPKVKHDKAIDFFHKLEKNSGDRLPKWVGELYLEYHRGTYTSQAKNKLANRRSEFNLHDAEFLASYANIVDSNFKYPKEQLEHAWKLICLNQFHDIIPGSSIAEVYVDSMVQYQEITEIAASSVNDSLTAIAAQTGGDIIAANPTSFTRSDYLLLDCELQDSQSVKAPDGTVLPIQATADGVLIDCGTLTPYSITPLQIVNDSAAAPSSMTISESLLENDFIRIELNAAGDITRILDKANDRELIPSGEIANQFIAFEDRPLRWDAWDVDIYYQEKTNYAEPATTIKIVEDGPLRITLEITRTILSSTYTQKISLSANSPQIDFTTTIDWQERSMLLKAAFPLELLSDQATYEIQWGNVKRPTHSNTSWDWAKFESCAQKWVDLSETNYGVSLLNDCKYGHDIHDNIMRITLLKSGIYPDPKADEGVHTFTYCLLPHSGPVGSDTINAAYALNDPIIGFRSDSTPAESKSLQSFISTDSDNVVIETVKLAEDSDSIIVRLYESLGQRSTAKLTTAFDLKACYISDLLENQLDQVPVTDNSVDIKLTPFKIVTLKLEL